MRPLVIANKTEYDDTTDEEEHDSTTQENVKRVPTREMFQNIDQFSNNMSAELGDDGAEIPNYRNR